MKHLESEHQRMFVRRFRCDPRTRDLPACAVPNGGRRGPREAGILKAEGVSRGAPDFVLFVARDGAHSLCIEFKAEGGKQSAEQKAWQSRLEHEGHRYAVVFSALDAWALVTLYLGLEGC